MKIDKIGEIYRYERCGRQTNFMYMPELSGMEDTISSFTTMIIKLCYIRLDSLRTVNCRITSSNPIPVKLIGY